MTYGDLQTNFLSLLNRRDCTATQAQGFLQNSITRIQRELRVPAMEKTAIVTIDNTYVATTGMSIPSDMLELMDIIPLSSQGAATNLQRLEKCDISRALILAKDVGIPAEYSRLGGAWVLGPAPFVGDQYIVRYYAELGALVNSTDSNIISIIASDLIVYAALSYAGDFFTDKRTSTWEARYMQIRDDLQAQADDDEESGAAAVQPAFAYPNDLGDFDYPYPVPGSF